MQRDADPPDVSGWIADRLATARDDARRIGRELLRDGRVTPEEVDALASAVDEAVERGLALIGDAQHELRRILVGLRRVARKAAARTEDAAVPAASDDDLARIARLEARVAALEALVTGQSKAGAAGVASPGA